MPVSSAFNSGAPLPPTPAVQPYGSQPVLTADMRRNPSSDSLRAGAAAASAAWQKASANQDGLSSGRGTNESSEASDVTPPPLKPLTVPKSPKLVPGRMASSGGRGSIPSTAV